jgi:glucose-1-phosphate adenylyltransferase
MVLAQYRPHSLIEHIGAGAPWDLNRDFTGGVRILTPYKARFDSDWFEGNADAVQQNFSFIKRGSPDLILILSGDHIYTMDYDTMITFHMDQQADLTLATIRVPLEEASRFGVLTVDNKYRVKSFIEKPKNPPSGLINMGVYLFNRELLDRALWEDHLREDSYWQAHMDMLSPNPPLKLYDRSWIIHTRTEERPPVHIPHNASIFASLLSDGCTIQENARIESSVLSPGVIVRPGAVVRESIILTDTIIESGAVIERAILDKHVHVEQNARIGGGIANPNIQLAVVGKNSIIPSGMIIEPGGTIGTDVTASDYPGPMVKSGEILETKRQPYEI